jgi:hypothetical protein
MVHTKVFAPLANAVTPEVGLEEVVTNAVPSDDHAPVPGVAAFPAKVAVVLAQIP